MFSNGSGPAGYYRYAVLRTMHVYIPPIQYWSQKLENGQTKTSTTNVKTKNLRNKYKNKILNIER